jgi:hypothetical protein
MADDSTPHTPTPETPRDPGWWTAFGEALLTGEFETEVDPEVKAAVDRWRDRATSVAGHLLDGFVGDRWASIEKRLSRLEEPPSQDPASDAPADQSAT